MDHTANVKSKFKDSGIDASPWDHTADSIFTQVARAVVIGTAGNIKVTTLQGNIVTLVGVPAGVLPLCVTKIFASGTTARDISVIF
jgi:hypothetical protein